jgi:hypothetical protein
MLINVAAFCGKGEEKTRVVEVQEVRGRAVGNEDR